MRHKGQSRHSAKFGLPVHIKLHLLLQPHTRPDLNKSTGTARHELYFLLVLGDRHLLLPIVLLIAALLHEVLRLDDDHASDVQFVRSFMIRGQI